ncbi:hypothetical protein E3C22_16370 [Jiella endophytica]|uniref:Uncharacterized protein n=1 Tax=Jiella endophytica TaxID=2558362 RepID=A0A4Y8RFJ6_9HYPH|nr:hypothetical protein [Jiella endophytica]TFF20483.1 hypothetical protein E3C22_16370 [Jiella endophytica]
MSSLGRPPLDGLKRQLLRARDHRSQGAAGAADNFVRETFTLERGAARLKAREWFEKFPKAAYWTQVESWRQLPDERIEFTMRRLPTAD